MIKISISNDAISTDLGTAVEFVQDHPLCREMELRQLGFNVAPDWDERWTALAEKLVVGRKLHITVLATDLALTGPLPEARMDALLALAQRLQAPAVSVLAGPAAGDPDAFEDALAAFGSAAAGRKLQVWLRNAAGTLADDPATAVEVLEAIGAENIGFEWDVAAAVPTTGSTGLAEIDAVRPRLRAVRVSDGVRQGTGLAPVTLGKGVLPWEDLLEQLHAGGFRGAGILEPRMPNRLREAHAALQQFARWLEPLKMKRPPREDDDAEETGGFRPHRRPGPPPRGGDGSRRPGLKR